MDRDVDQATDEPPAAEDGAEPDGEAGGVSQPTPASMLLYILAISSLGCAVPSVIGEFVLGVSGPVFVPALVLMLALMVELASDFLRGPHRGARPLQMAAGVGMIALGLIATQMTLTVDPEPTLLQSLRYGLDVAWLGLGGLLVWHGR